MSHIKLDYIKKQYIFYYKPDILLIMAIVIAITIKTKWMVFINWERDK